MLDVQWIILVSLKTQFPRVIMKILISTQSPGMNTELGQQ